VGQAWLNVLAIKGILGAFVSEISENDGNGRRGIDMGRFGFEVADVGNGGSDNNSGVSPGTSRATTF